MNEWSFGDSNSCPESTNPKRKHIGVTQSRTKVLTPVPDRLKHKSWARPTTSYVDHVKCKFCGAEHDQEWMPAGI
jgi:hypothetical protein